MAIIKQPSQKKERFAEKTITLPADLWRELTNYAKFAEIGGKPADKANYIVGEALKHVFTTDEAFQKAKKEAAADQEKAEVAAKATKPNTPNSQPKK